MKSLLEDLGVIFTVAVTASVYAAAAVIGIGLVLAIPAAIGYLIWHVIAGTL